MLVRLDEVHSEEEIQKMREELTEKLGRAPTYTELYAEAARLRSRAAEARRRARHEAGR